ncbi:MAG: DNA repair protein RecO [Candidatus Coproplasma sp.]
MEGIKVNALMLRAVDYKENDKILTLLTAEKGKISAGIKGVKKAGAKLKFAAQPFCFAEYILAMRGDKYTVTQATECESFYDLRCDVERFYAASAVCEAANALCFEGDESAEIFYPAVKALSEMCSGDHSRALIAFLLTALGAAGYPIGLENCTECGAPLVSADKMRFDMNTGSFTCWDCGDGIGASGVTYNALRMCAGKPYDKGFITADGIKRALRLLKEYFTFKTDAKCVSLSEYIRLI